MNRLIMDTQGIRVSKPGINVLTADPSQLSFDSRNKQLMVWHTANYARAGNTTAGYYSFPSLSYTPLVHYQINVGGNWVQGVDTGVFTDFALITPFMGSPIIQIRWSIKLENVYADYCRVTLFNLEGNK